MSAQPESRAAGSMMQTLLWGVFCACSWTWCIGMFLPRIMIERFGWPGLLAFALPNVLGCAAFGYFVKNRVASQTMVIRHGPAMAWFSVATIAYHMFFIVYLLGDVIPLFGDGAAWPLATAAIIWCLGIVLSFLPDRDWLRLSALVYGVSLAAMFVIGFDRLPPLLRHGRDNIGELLWLTPILWFGFLLSPYLDLTFHRALQRSPSRHSFAVFGVSFAMMIVLTWMMWFSQTTGEAALGFVLIHIMAQTVFTVGAHLRELRESKAIRDEPRRWVMMALPISAAAILPIARMVSDAADLGESIYLRFLVFYGLVFPAYVLLLIAAWRAHRAVGNGTLMLIALIVFSLPLYEMGFLHHEPRLMIAPLTVLLLWALVLPRLTHRAAER